MKLTVPVIHLILNSLLPRSNQPKVGSRSRTVEEMLLRRRGTFRCPNQILPVTSPVDGQRVQLIRLLIHQHIAADRLTQHVAKQPVSPLRLVLHNVKQSAIIGRPGKTSGLHKSVLQQPPAAQIPNRQIILPKTCDVRQPRIQLPVVADTRRNRRHELLTLSQNVHVQQQLLR